MQNFLAYFVYLQIHLTVTNYIIVNSHYRLSVHAEICTNL